MTDGTVVMWNDEPSLEVPFGLSQPVARRGSKGLICLVQDAARCDKLGELSS